MSAVHKVCLAILLSLMTTAASAANCGMSFFRFGQMICDAELYWESSYFLIHTRPGERVMRPELGVNWDTLCFAPLTDEALAQMEAVLLGQIEENVGIDVESVDIVTVDGDLPEFEVRVTYRPDGPDGPRETLVLPYRCGR